MKGFAGADLRAKLALVAGLTLLAFVAPLAVLGLLLVATEGLLVASGLGPRQRLLALGGLLAIPYALLNAALYGATPLFAVGPVVFRAEGLAAGLAFGARAVLAMMAGLWLVGTTPPQEALRLLHRWPRVSLAVAGTLRFLPLAAEDWQQVREAQRLRGHEVARGLHAPAQAVPLMVPLFVLTVRRGAALEEAIEASGFGSGPRTRYPDANFGARDASVLAVAIALFSLVLLHLARAGGVL